jgi:hypothetical protein
MSDFYIDSSNFSLATAVWVDPQLNTKAPDGYYAFSGNYRQQVSGLLQSSISCTLPQFIPSVQSPRKWTALAAASNGDVYAVTDNEGVWKQTGGVGIFNPINLVEGNHPYVGVAVLSNGNIYINESDPDGNFYVSTNGGTQFDIQYPPPQGNNYSSLCSGNVTSTTLYYTENIGYVFRRTTLTGNFVPISSANRAWTCVAEAPNGDVYAGVSRGNLWKATGGTGTFVDVTGNLPTKKWTGVAAASNGDIYATTSTSVDGPGDIFKQTGGTGDFVSMGMADRQYNGITITPSGRLYFAIYNDYIYYTNYSVLD